MAPDCRRTLGARFRSGAKVRVEFRMGGTGDASADSAAEKAVVLGLYGYVRNPMYSGFFAGWAGGLWVVFGRADPVAIAVASAVVVGTALFVLLYEERTLRRVFGAEYKEYCRNVPRWVPRMRPWPAASGR